MKKKPVNVTAAFIKYIRMPREANPDGMYLSGFIGANEQWSVRNRVFLSNLYAEIPVYMKPIARELRDICWKMPVYFTDYWTTESSILWQNDFRNRQHFFDGTRKTFHVTMCVPFEEFFFQYETGSRFQSVTVHSGHALIQLDEERKKKYVVEFMEPQSPGLHHQGIVNDFTDSGKKQVASFKLTSGTRVDCDLETLGENKFILHLFRP